MDLPKNISINYFLVRVDFRLNVKFCSYVYCVILCTPPYESDFYPRKISEQLVANRSLVVKFMLYVMLRPALGQFAVGQFAVGTVRRKKRKKNSNLTNLT